MFRLEQLDTVSSTNDVVKSAIADGGPEGFAVCARKQTGGYGRQGRFWESPVGGMYLSVLLRPNVDTRQLSTLSLAVGVAVRRALSGVLLECAGGSQAAERVLLKWPNDVVFGCGMPFKKLCGISLEQTGGAVCAGIGVNVFPPDPEVCISEDSDRCAERSHPVYLAQLCDSGSASGIVASAALENDALSVQYVRESVLDELEQAYHQWQSCGFGSLREEYESYSALHGRSVEIDARDGSFLYEGEVQGIDELGCLVIRDSDGKIVHAASGEAHIRHAGAPKRL